MISTPISATVTEQVGAIVGDFERRLHQQLLEARERAHELELQLAVQENEHKLELALRDRRHREELSKLLGDNLDLDMQLEQAQARAEHLARENQQLEVAKVQLASDVDYYRRKFSEATDHNCDLQWSLEICASRLREEELTRQADCLVVEEYKVCPDCRSIDTVQDGRSRLCRACGTSYQLYLSPD